MKKILLTAMALCCLGTASAQEKVRHISLELLGAHNIVGLNYDSRFNGNSGWGYRVGVGYTYGESLDFFGESNLQGVAVPLELNYLFGKRNHKFELGVGASLGVYSIKESGGYVSWSGQTTTYNNTSSTFGYFIFSNIGYRYQRDNGFMFRCGFSPSFNFGDECGVTKSMFYPYIGLGWSF